MLSFSRRNVLDEICDLIESVSEGFPSYSSTERNGLSNVEEVYPRNIPVKLFQNLSTD